MIRVELPAHLRTLGQITGEVNLEVEGIATQASLLDALEARYPMLRGTLRDQVTRQRRPFIRFFACEEDLSHNGPEDPLPEAVASGKEHFWIVGAIAGGRHLRQDQSLVPRTVLALRVPLDLRLIKVHFAQLAFGISLRLIVKVFALWVATLTAR